MKYTPGYRACARLSPDPTLLDTETKFLSSPSLVVSNERRSIFTSTRTTAGPLCFQYRECSSETHEISIGPPPTRGGACSSQPGILFHSLSFTFGRRNFAIPGEILGISRSTRVV